MLRAANFLCNDKMNFSAQISPGDNVIAESHPYKAEF